MASCVTSRKRGVCGRASAVCLVLAVALVSFCGWAPAAETTGRPVLLVYGFQPLPGFYAPFLWEGFAEALSGRPLGEIEKVTIASGHQVYRLAASSDGHRDVVVGDYTMAFEPTVRGLRFYAARLSDEIAWVAETHGASQIDVVAHSMGGLIARCYIEAEDFAEVLGSEDFEDFGIEYRDDVHMLITLATPHHGAEFAAVGPWYGTLARQLPPDSRLLELLNRSQPGEPGLNASVRYVSMAGQSCLGCGLRRDEAGCLRACAEEGAVWDGSDLVVRMASAWLNDGENVACIGFNHVEMRTHPLVLETVLVALDAKPIPGVVYRSEVMIPEDPGG